MMDYFVSGINDMDGAAKWVWATGFWPDHTLFSSYEGLKSHWLRLVCFWSRYRLRVKVKR